jgi:hypothetical protein
MITAYVFGNAPPAVRPVTRDLRALWALEESGLPYRLQALDFGQGELKRPECTRSNPFGHLPSIDDDGLKLFESAAIVLRRREDAHAAQSSPGPRARRAVGVRRRQRSSPHCSSSSSSTTSPRIGSGRRNVDLRSWNRSRS